MVFFALPPQSVPTLHSTSFSGQSVDLPDALHGHKAILILGFTRNAQGPVTDWARRLAADYRDSPTILYFEMPVLAGVPRLLRGVVLSKIRKDVPPRAQPRFVPILDHEDEWKSAAGYTPAAPDDAYLVLVDASGTIRRHFSAPNPTNRATPTSASPLTS